VLASGAAGLTALLAWSGPARRAAVWAQYALLLLAPVLVAMDPNS
jgi:hypothetical protein